MSLLNSDMFIVQRGTDTFKMSASLLKDFIGGSIFSGPNPPPNPSTDTLWFNETNNILYYWDGSVWQAVKYPASLNPPTDAQPGDIWYNLTLDQLQVWNGTNWETIGVNRGDTEPSNPVAGDLWYDTTNNILLVYNGSEWLPIDTDTGAICHVGDTAPDVAEIGDLWFNTVDGNLYVYTSNGWQNSTTVEIPSSVTTFIGFKRMENGDLILHYSEPDDDINYATADFEYKGGAQWMIATDAQLYPYYHPQKGIPMYSLNNSGHLILDII